MSTIKDILNSSIIARGFLHVLIGFLLALLVWVAVPVGAEVIRGLFAFVIGAIGLILSIIFFGKGTEKDKLGL